MTTTQPTTMHSKPALQLLEENIARLKHPAGIIKHPYFDDTFAANKDGVRDLRKKFCEGILLVFQDNPEVLVPIMTRAGYKCTKTRKQSESE